MPDNLLAASLTGTPQTANQIAYQTLYDSLHAKNDKGYLTYQLFITLLNSVPNLIDEIKNQASELTILVPKNDILNKLPNTLQTVLINDAKSSSSNDYLYHLLKNHIVKIKTTLDNNHLPSIIEIDSILIPDSLKSLVEKYMNPSDDSTNLKATNNPSSKDTWTLESSMLEPSPPPPTIQVAYGGNSKLRAVGDGATQGYSVQGVEASPMTFMTQGLAEAPPPQHIQASTPTPPPHTEPQLFQDNLQPNTPPPPQTIHKWLHPANLRNNIAGIFSFAD